MEQESQSYKRYLVLKRLKFLNVTLLQFRLNHNIVIIDIEVTWNLSKS